MGIKSILLSSGLVALASAFTPPNFSDQTFGALLLPDLNDPVTQGQTYQVKWDASQTTQGETVALVLCNGPGANCQLQSAAIVDGLDATTGSYSWSVPCSLPVGTQDTATGYGMLIIVDGTGQFQYSTQFSVLAGSSCSAPTSTTTSSTTSSSTSSSTTSSSAPTSPGWNAWNSTSTSTTPIAPITPTPSPWMATTSSSSPSPAWTTSAQVGPISTTASASPSQFTGAAAKNVIGSIGAVAAVGAAAFFAL